MKAALALLPLVLVVSCSSTHQAAALKSTWGGYPSYLPKSTTDGTALHTITNASVDHPALASQGDTVRVQLASGTALATVVGPGVPNQGLPYQGPTSQVTWTVTLRGISGIVPVDTAAFNTIDEFGRVYRLQLSPSAPLPRELKAGQRTTFKLATSMHTGEGRMRWIPSGHLAPVEWDFTVEID